MVPHLIEPTLSKSREAVEIGATIAVPGPWRQFLAALRVMVGDNLGEQFDPHITLIPPTRIDADDLLEFAGHLEKVASETPPFRIRLQGAQSFRPRSNVVFAPLVAGAEECTALADLLRSGPVDVPLDFDYHPHVTAAQDIGDAGLDQAERYLRDFAAEFIATEIGLSTRTCSDATEPWRSVDRARLGTSAGADR
jgi:2'-5' RNA ligase